MASVAAVDCGTNSTRLLVADDSGRPLARLMEITRLGRDVDRTRRLDPGAIARTVEVLRGYRQVMDRHGVERLRITATSAARDATNREDFFGPAAEAVGAVPELLGGDAEGRLSFAGATAALDPSNGPWLVVDIGGGSTEMAVGPDPAGARLDPVAVCSLDVGCVRLTERALPSDPPTTRELGAARALVDDMLTRATAEQPALRDGRSMVGLAGTVAALAALDIGLDDYDRDRLHHHLLGRDTVERLLAQLSGEDAAARRRRPGMEAARADVIVGGTIVAAAVLDHFGLDRCLTSEADILDGLVMSLLG